MPTSTETYYPNATYWQTARKIQGSGAKSFPISGAAAHFTIADLYAVKPANYSRLALDTAHAVETSAYLVDEQVTARSAVFTYFRRTYATIPASHTELGSCAWSFPGFDTTVTLPAYKTITSYNAGTRVYTSAAHGFSNGDFVVYSIKSADAFGYYTYNSQGTAEVSDVTTDTFKLVGFKIQQSFVSGVVYKIGTTANPRDPVSLSVDCHTSYDYYLPGVTSGITTTADIPRVSSFTPIDADGAVTDVLSSTTAPTANEYLAMVVDGELLAIESFIERYLGNIYRRVTRYVRAT